MRIAILALSLALTAGPALAGDNEAAPAKDDQNKVVCKKEMIPNSRFTKRTCLTKADWQQRSDTAQEAMRAIQTRTQTYSGKGN